MTALHIPPTGLSVVGWPTEPYRYSSKESTLKRSAVVLKVNKQIVQELREFANNGKAVRLLGGRVPRIQYGSKSIDLQVEPEKFISELYTSSSEGSLEHVAAITQRARLASTTALPDTRATDTALAALKHSLATVAHDKQAKQATISSSVFADPQIAKRNRILSDRVVPKAGSQYNSPSLGASKSTSSAPTSAPTSAPINDQVKAERQRALVPVILHLLACEPKDEHSIHKTTRLPTSDLLPILQKYAQLDNTTKAWKLRDRSYKDLDLWNFDWRGRTHMRDRAIENSIRAYDRLRLGKEDKLWQLLLPLDERGKGKLLSRLHGNTQTATHLSVRDAKSPLRGASSPLGPSSDTEGKLNGKVTDTSKPASASASRMPGSGKSMSIEKRLKESQKARAAEEAKRKGKEMKASNTQGTAAAKGAKVSPTIKRQQPSKFKSDELVHSSDDESEGEVKTAHIIKTTAQPARRCSPLGTSSSDGKPLKDSARVTNAKSTAPRPVASATATKRESPHKAVVSKGAATPLPSADAKVRAEARKETPTGRVEKRDVPQLSPRKADQTKPKNPSPLGRTGNAMPSIFGNHERSTSLVKKTTVVAAPPPIKKRPAPTDDSERGDRPRKTVKTNGETLASSAPKRSAAAAAVTTSATKRGPSSPSLNPAGPLKRKPNNLSPTTAPTPPHGRTISASHSPGNASGPSSGRASGTTTARTSISQSPPCASASLPHPPCASASLPHPPANGAYSPSTASSAEDPLASKDGWERAVEDADRFRTVLYPNYLQMYDKVMAMGDHADTEDVKRFWKQHIWLTKFKKEIQRRSAGGV